MRRAVRILVVLALVAYVGAVGYLTANERNLVFHPAERTVHQPPAALALNLQPVTFRASDSTSVTAWVIPALNADTPATWMVICHGNYGNIGYGGRARF